MTQVKVKICGITRAADAGIAAQSGADFIGLNFYSGPRRIDLDRAKEILTAIGPDVIPVALIDTSSAESPDLIRKLSEDLNIRTFQLYGEWDKTALPNGLEASLNFWPVVRVADKSDLTNLPWRLAGLVFEPEAILFDAFSPEFPGGTGKSFSWKWISNARASGALEGVPEIILAGGLTPPNISEAIRTTQPWAVDVSSGVEIPGQPGIKDAAKIRDFIAAAKK